MYACTYKFLQKKIKEVIRKKLSDFLLWNKRYCVFYLFMSQLFFFIQVTNFWKWSIKKKSEVFFQKELLTKIMKCV